MINTPLVIGDFPAPGWLPLEDLQASPPQQHREPPAVHRRAASGRRPPGCAGASFGGTGDGKSGGIGKDMIYGYLWIIHLWQIYE